MEAGSQRLREKGRKAIVAADDAEHLLTAGGAFVGELVGERQQRQLGGVCEKEAAKTDGDVPQALRRADAIEPLGDGLARERGRDPAIPSLLAEAERTDFRLQPLLQVLPRVPAANAAPAADLAGPM